MSQNKTVFPGVGQEGDDLSQRYHQSEDFDNYSHSSNFNRVAGTVCPGIDEKSSNDVSNAQMNRHVGCKKPIVGFLYSISRIGVGEFWPLYIGQNVIGSSPSCDIVLKEATISQRHATLHINKMKKPEKIEATISDSQSTNGTMVNGNSVSVARPPECVNGDIITIGENYELLFILIDVKAYGLEQSSKFIPSDDDDNEEMVDNYQNDSSNNKERTTRNQQDFPPRFLGPDSQYDCSSRPTDSTVGIDPSSNNEYNKGWTVGME